MAIGINEILISFQFKYNDRTEIVYARNITIMEQFLRQHNFLKNNQPIEEFYRLHLFHIDTVANHIDWMPDNSNMCSYHEYVDEDIPIELVGRLLKHFKFKSNNNQEEFIVISNDYLVASAIKLACYELTDALYFGGIILKAEDIHFIRVIYELINSLPKVSVLDLIIMEEDIDFDYSKDKIKNDEKREYYISNHVILTDNVFSEDTLDDVAFGHFHDVGCYYVYESFIGDCYIELTQPITMEAYIDNFIKALT